MGEKEQATYSLKQRSGPCSVYPSPEGVRETLAWSETHEKIAQSPSCSFLVVQSLNSVWFFVTPWTAPRQASLSFTISLSLLKLVSITSVIPSNHLVLFHPLLLPSIFLSIRVFSNESALCIRWPKYWSFSFNVSPSNEYSGLIFLGLTGLILQSKGLLRVFSNTTIQIWCPAFFRV